MTVKSNQVFIIVGREDTLGAGFGTGGTYGFPLQSDAFSLFPKREPSKPETNEGGFEPTNYRPFKHEYAGSFKTGL